MAPASPQKPMAERARTVTSRRDIRRDIAALDVTLGVTFGRDIDRDTVTSDVTVGVTLGVTLARAPLLRRGCHAVTVSVTRDVTSVQKRDIETVTCKRDIPAWCGDITLAGKAQVLKEVGP